MAPVRPLRLARWISRVELPLQQCELQYICLSLLFFAPLNSFQSNRRITHRGPHRFALATMYVEATSSDVPAIELMDAS
ncbi:hypothetical protein B0H17DRAFT_1219133 [Mycena rosella]|uniref:Uncharacterized protein n=1 Tax=Mycena rosella TaxID=1033263 RepID=A0AAD7FJ22_MYCRO|nr:hypothetical protein B0H17DRAFT_1219133 [Mycena rosella]